MKAIANSIMKAVSVTRAFRSGLAEATETEEEEDVKGDVEALSGHSIFNPIVDADLGPGRKTLNLGGLDIPLIEGELSRVERIFLKSAEYGDAATIKQLIDNAKAYHLNVNCMDAMGRGVLRIAIETEHVELLQLLLTDEHIELRDSLLHAISEENVQAVELILQAQSARSQRKNLKGLLGHIESSSFTPDITPLILAAHRDNYAIIKLLLERGNRIAKPHELRCACNACVQANREDSLQHSKLRINAYRALSSPCFMALSSPDPILTAFELSWELKRLGRLENEFKEDYEKLSVSCQDFATALLAQTRGSAELAIVLNYDSGAADTSPPIHFCVRTDSGGQSMKLSRLKLAIKYKQKNFVAHPHCQQLLASLWYDGLPGFRRKPLPVQAGTIALICLTFPLLSISFLIAPESRWGSMMRKPFIKFLCQSSAYLSFLATLSLVAIRIEYLATDTLETRMSCRDPLPSVIESIVMVYVAGFVWQEISNIWTMGVRAYTMDMWHLLDFVQNSLYVSTIAIRLAAWIRINVYGEPGIVDRSKWDAYDPVLISECLFAVANIFATLKLVSVFTVSPQLGPLQISLGRMLNDILKFFCVYILVLLAFAFGLNQLYWFYASNRKISCANVRFSLVENEKDVYEYCSTRGRYFTNIFEIVQTLYWSAYGLIDLTDLNLEYPHVFTEFVGKLIFGTYSCIAFIVLLNMLIAMMNNSYQQIAEQADTEWKFARSKMWISYFAEGGNLPVPFNLLPGRRTFNWIFTRCTCCCGSKSSDKNSEIQWQSVKEKVTKRNEQEERHQLVMRELVNRYLIYRQMHYDGPGITEDDLNEIKGDISAFRYELLDILRQNGMKVNGHDTMKTGGKLRRRGSKRGKVPSWKPEDLTLDDLQRGMETESSTPVVGLKNQVSKESTTVKKSGIVQSRETHINVESASIPSSFGGASLNSAFVADEAVCSSLSSIACETNYQKSGKVNVGFVTDANEIDLKETSETGTCETPTPEKKVPSMYTSLTTISEEEIMPKLKSDELATNNSVDKPVSISITVIKYDDDAPPNTNDQQIVSTAEGENSDATEEQASAGTIQLGKTYKEGGNTKTMEAKPNTHTQVNSSPQMSPSTDVKRRGRTDFV